MSHFKERSEKNCLNCGTQVAGRYCQTCGQENIEPKETVWHLIHHFFNDITHYDGKFFSTMKYLLKKPGFLSGEYMAGRRASYLNPIRMYVFTSAIFFLIVFALKKPQELVHFNEKTTREKLQGVGELKKFAATLKDSLKKIKDEDDVRDVKNQLEKLQTELTVIDKLYGDTTTRQFSKNDLKLFLSKTYNGKSNDGNDEDYTTVTDVMGSGDYRTVAAYDSAENKLPDSLRDGWLARTFKRKMIHINEEFHHDKKGYYNHVGENILHSIPKVLFWSLPFFALILNIMYFRHKQYLYADHGIFTIHVYCAIFLLCLTMILANKLAGEIGYGWFTVVKILLNIALWIYMFYYIFRAMRRFYGQRRGKTLLKYLILGTCATTINLIILLIFILISVVSI